MKTLKRIQKIAILLLVTFMCSCTGNAQKSAIALLEEKAQTGDANAMVELGYKYQSGDGLEKDYAMAKKWYESAAALNQNDAMRRMGNLYRNGLGVETSGEKAIAWYTKAADLEDPDAYYNLGTLYREGEVVEKDHLKALSWFKKTLPYNDAEAMYFIGLIYAEGGHGIEKNDQESHQWYKKSAEMGHARAMFKWGDVLRIQKNLKDAVYWYEKAVEQGNVNAMAALAVMYNNGEGVEVDKIKGNKLMLAAAEKGNSQAMYNLYRTESSNGNMDVAEEWLTLSAKKGNIMAINDLEKFNKYKLWDFNNPDYNKQRQAFLINEHAILVAQAVILEKMAAHFKQQKPFDFDVETLSLENSNSTDYFKNTVVKSIKETVAYYLNKENKTYLEYKEQNREGTYYDEFAELIKKFYGYDEILETDFVAEAYELVCTSSLSGSEICKSYRQKKQAGNLRSVAQADMPDGSSWKLEKTTYHSPTTYGEFMPKNTKANIAIPSTWMVDYQEPYINRKYLQDIALIPEDKKEGYLKFMTNLSPPYKIPMAYLMLKVQLNFTNYYLKWDEVALLGIYTEGGGKTTHYTSTQAPAVPIEHNKYHDIKEMGFILYPELLDDLQNADEFGLYIQTKTDDIKLYIIANSSGFDSSIEKFKLNYQKYNDEFTLRPKARELVDLMLDYNFDSDSFECYAPVSPDETQLLESNYRKYEQRSEVFLNCFKDYQGTLDAASNRLNKEVLPYLKSSEGFNAYEMEVLLNNWKNLAEIVNHNYDLLDKQYKIHTERVLALNILIENKRANQSEATRNRRTSQNSEPQRRRRTEEEPSQRTRADEFFEQQRKPVTNFTPIVIPKRSTGPVLKGWN